MLHARCLGDDCTCGRVRGPSSGWAARAPDHNGVLLAPVAQPNTDAITQASLQKAYKVAISDAHVRLAIVSTPVQACDRGKSLNWKMSSESRVPTCPKMTKEPSANLSRESSGPLIGVGGSSQEIPAIQHCSICDTDSWYTPFKCQQPEERTEQLSNEPCSLKALAHQAMTGDAVGHILAQVSRKDIGNLRLTCRSWRHAVSQKVAVLVPVKLPPSCLAERFPSLSSLDLTALGAMRIRSFKLSLLGCQKNLTRLEIGDSSNGGGAWLCNRDMDTLAQLGHLRQLKIFNPRCLTMQGINRLSELSALEVRSRNAQTMSCTPTNR
jgi:hypothetical protein